MAKKQSVPGKTGDIPHPVQKEKTYRVRDQLQLKLWEDVQRELTRLLREEMPAEPPPPEKDRALFCQRVAVRYVRYIQIYKQLDTIYDQVVHPQKRRTILAILEGLVGRLLELKNEMVEKELSEYHYLDDILHHLKLKPADLEIPLPRYLITECSKELLEQKSMVSEFLKMVKVPESPEPPGVEDMSSEEAIKTIQIAERARQGRLRAKLNEESRNMNSRSKTRLSGASASDMAAVCIQKVWRGYAERRRVKIARDEEMIFLGMTMDPKHQVACPAEVTARAREACTRMKQQEHEEDYQKSMEAAKKQLLDMEGYEMSKTMKDQIRQWFIECRDATGFFPEFPVEEDGGSSTLFVEKTPQQLKEEIAAKEEEEARKELEAKDDKKDKGKDKAKDKAKKDKGKAEEEEEVEEGFRMLPSAFLSDLEAGNKNFVAFWKSRNESRNFMQRHEEELMKEEKRRDIEAELRVQVDEQMRLELAEWKLVVDKDKGGKAKGNAKKKEGGKKKKKEKDLTVKRTLESLCEELVEQGLLKQPRNVGLQDYLGDYSYFGTTQRQYGIEPTPSLSDVRQVLTLFGILPLGSQAIHEKAPLIKAILLTGPAGVGKKMLVHAICHETGATLFDLSPLNTAGKYPGKSGLAMMIHMVLKVARLLQPSVIWIGDAEKMFYKKVPKIEKEFEPKRLKKDLPKSLKLIKGEDRVLIVGTSNQPVTADIKTMCKMYSKIIIIPRPVYSSRCILWKQLIRNQGAEVTKALDLSSLAEISDGYTPGHMVQVIQSVLTKRRITQLANRPLTAAEFVAPLAKIPTVSKDEEKAFKVWFEKTPLEKKRIEAATGPAEEEAPVKGKDAKKKGKK